MAQTSAKVDQYILNAQPFAQPILEHLRALIHESCPVVVETIKWGMPHFEYNGKNLCSFAAFKKHCSLTFWMAGEMKTFKKLNKDNTEGMGHFGKITSAEDLPSNKDLKACFKEAMTLLDNDFVLKRNKPGDQKEIEIPDYFTKALKTNKKAKANFDKAAYSWKKEYVEWIAGAKTEATREKRMNTALEWIAEGKARNWKYETRRATSSLV